MSAEGVRFRTTTNTAFGSKRPKNHVQPSSEQVHPGGPVKHGVKTQALRLVLFTLYFLVTSLCVHINQFMGAPLYFHNQDYYYAWMALTKQHYCLVLLTATQWWSPTMIRVSGDESVRGQLKQTPDGRLECDFPERLVMIANHQIYTDWVYLWWTSYTARMHGHLYIILKESLKWIPVLGPGMQFFSFVFLSRKWESDKPRFQHRLQKLNGRHKGPLSGTQSLDPMWLLIFPEGTNMSTNARASSQKWAEKSGQSDLIHTLLPRSTGLHFCLNELRDTVDWVYDCTVAYEGVEPGQYGQDIFTIRTVYFQGQPPKSVNMHWRRFAVSSIPLDDAKTFEKWLRARWEEKDALIEQYCRTGRFPADKGPEALSVNGGQPIIKKGAGYIETEVRASNPFEFLQMFVPTALLGLILYQALRLYKFIFVRRLGFKAA
ncbi:acyltransferase-domain-containing protein [Patellaria atrata CBS 101060]|uniref:Acyltransferase-domain-containing protein n=1 Tax=Patellaria atrata CBS 101060 TaxID=1346257 RepID=A0A9P4VS21_9PEZI|nr:acyltransferase-domain-containing protein [Patellaria atrata CBS 101060]